MTLTASRPFLENYALEDCLKCSDLQIRVQVNADEDLLQNIHPSRHVKWLATLTGSKYPTYPTIIKFSEAGTRNEPLRTSAREANVQ